MDKKLYSPDQALPAEDAWKLFRIMAEFVDGFETISQIRPCISIFGSARLKKNSPYCKQAYSLSKKLAKNGYSIITGAGPGIMEAANKGAQEGKSPSCGLIIDVPYETEPNPFLDPKLRLHFRYFFVRKVMFMRYAEAMIFFPGGFGSLDEFFETITLIQTERTQPIPIFLVGKSYWKGLLDWLKETVHTNGCIKKEDLSIFTLTDNIDDIVKKLKK